MLNTVEHVESKLAKYHVAKPLPKDTSGAVVLQFSHPSDCKVMLFRNSEKCIDVTPMFEVVTFENVVAEEHSVGEFRNEL